MDCREARTHLLDLRRGALDDSVGAQVEAHLAECGDCTAANAADRELSTLLEERLPMTRAPETLRLGLSAKWDPRPTPLKRRAALLPVFLGAMVALAAALVVFPRFLFPRFAASSGPNAGATEEMVTDHLRVLYSEHPIEVESGGLHQVKPWFAGRLDFAPIVAFAGDDEFPLQGGAVAYFLDRKAATFLFKRRLHVITLFVFRAEGLPWPSTPAHGIGDAMGTSQTSRGFHTLLWKKGDLGYALVSDLDAKELDLLGAKVAGGS
jgi:anti-sigma factor RsiW